MSMASGPIPASSSASRIASAEICFSERSRCLPHLLIPTPSTAASAGLGMSTELRDEGLYARQEPTAPHRVPMDHSIELQPFIDRQGRRVEDGSLGGVYADATGLGRDAGGEELHLGEQLVGRTDPFDESELERSGRSDV